MGTWPTPASTLNVAWGRRSESARAYSAIGAAIQNGVLLANDAVLGDLVEALRVAERSGDDLALGSSRLAMGIALLQRDSIAEHDRGVVMMGQIEDMCLNGLFYKSELWHARLCVAGERARRGDRNAVLPMMREAVDHLFRAGQIAHVDAATGDLVETLLSGGEQDDVAEAEAAIARLAGLPTDDGLVIRDIWLLKLQILLARARGDETAYRDCRDRYRALATSLGFEGHMKWAEAMP